MLKNNPSLYKINLDKLDWNSKKEFSSFEEKGEDWFIDKTSCYSIKNDAD